MWFDTAQVHIGVELSVAIGPPPASRKAKHGGPDLGGLGLGMLLGAEMKFNPDDFGAFGGPFVHARLGNGWRGLTLGAVAGYAMTNGYSGHQHLFSLGAETGVAFVSGLKPSLHVGGRMQGLVVGQVRVTTHLLHDDYVTHDPTFAVGLMVPLISPYGEPLPGAIGAETPPPDPAPR